MKSKLSAALAAGACVLAVNPANALSITFNPNATMTTVPGAVLFDDFDSVQDTTIGTIVRRAAALRRTTIRIRQPPSVVSPAPSLALDSPG
jgi:hypothetical protein